jgi:hypothetical protein
MTMPPGVIEVDLFSKKVNSTTHPDAVRFRKTLESVAKEYRCRLTSFTVKEGIVSFSFGSDGLMADILKILQAPPDPPDSGK